MVCTGLGIANLYPIAVEYGLGEAPSRQDAASSRIVMASGTAILSFPIVVGGSSDIFGLDVALPVAVLTVSLAAFAVFSALNRTDAVTE